MTPASGEIHLQMPVNIEGFQGLPQVRKPAQLTSGAGETRGVISAVLVAAEMPHLPDPWNGFEAQLEKAKKLFHELFLPLLKNDTVKALDPVYEQ